MSLKKLLTIGMIPADGIGKEVIPAAQRVMESLGSLDFKFITLPAGFDHFNLTGSALPEETVRVLKSQCDAAMFGAVSSPSHKVKNYSSPIVALRKQMDLFANVRPISSAKGALGKPIDMLIIRENTECLYIKSERLEIDPITGMQVAWADRKISEFASKRIARMAFDMALVRQKARQFEASPLHKSAKVTIVHKSNVLSVTDGLFRESCRAVSLEKPEYKDIIVEEQLVEYLNI